MTRNWWKEAVVYQIYVRSFKDSNGDGIGDLQGIIDQLDYLKWLGIDAIYLNPINQSPNYDNGYDISDFRAIMKEFGSFQTFERLLFEVHKRDMKLIMDLVINHTSHEHPWFIESRKSEDNPYRDYYIWQKTDDNKPPNNWGSFFGGSAWQYDELTEAYYLHIFAKEQPDLNWENQKLRKAIQEMIKFWIDHNVDGFRIDAINHLAKNLEFPDGKVTSDSKYGDFIKHVQNLPKVHDYIQELRAKAFNKSDKDIVLIGETGGISYENAHLYTAPSREELDMTFHFDYHSTGIGKKPWEKVSIDLVKDLKEKMSGWQNMPEKNGWFPVFYSNHDTTRTVSRLGDDTKFHNASATMLALIQLTQRGTPFIYYGDEIGMTNPKDFTLDDYKDISVQRNYQEKVLEGKLSEKKFLKGLHLTSRDNSRTPMQWSDEKYSGFSESQPWIRVNSNYKTLNVKEQKSDRRSILNFYKKLIALRKRNQTFIYGSYKDVDYNNNQLYSYYRQDEEKTFLIITNFTKKKVPLNEMMKSLKKELVLSNYDVIEGIMQPYEGRIYQVKA
jgi:oligo-1,6-glucosidase